MKRAGLQAWLERSAQGPAFAISATCMVMRAASAYSGGAFNLPSLLGHAGMQVFDMVTGVGLAVGAELLASIAGRSGRRHHDNASDAASMPGLKRYERDARIQRENAQATLDGWFSLGGLLASIYGAMWFLWNLAPNHDIPTIAGELIVTAILVGIVYYLGVIAEPVQEHPREVATAHVHAMNLGLLQQAGKRLSSGDFQPQDVALYAEYLPRTDRARFRAVMGRDSVDDPLWAARDITLWLHGAAPDDIAVRRRVSRGLRAAEERGMDVRRDDRGAYVVPRSLALRLFASDFLELAGRADVAGTIPRARRSIGPVLRLEPPAPDATMTGPRQPQDAHAAPMPA